MSVLSKCGRADFLLWGNSLPMETRWNVSGPNWCGNTLNSDNTHTQTQTHLFTHTCFHFIRVQAGWVCYQRSSGLVCRVLMADLCSVWRERCLIIALIICSVCQMTTTNCCDHEGCQQRHVECDLLLLFGNSWMAKQNRNLSWSEAEKQQRNRMVSANTLSVFGKLATTKRLRNAKMPLYSVFLHCSFSNCIQLSHAVAEPHVSAWGCNCHSSYAACILL